MFAVCQQHTHTYSNEKRCKHNINTHNSYNNYHCYIHATDVNAVCRHTTPTTISLWAACLAHVVAASQMPLTAGSTCMRGLHSTLPGRMRLKWVTMLMDRLLAVCACMCAAVRACVRFQVRLVIRFDLSCECESSVQQLSYVQHHQLPDASRSTCRLPVCW